jgi:hypothetical protein
MIEGVKMWNPNQMQEINHDAFDSYLHDYLMEHLKIKTKVYTKAYDDDIYFCTALELDGEEICDSKDRINAKTISHMAKNDHWDD